MTLHEYYRLLTDFHDQLRVFRLWNSLWKASVLVASDLVTDVDEGAERLAATSWGRLETIHTRLKRLHRTLGIPGPLIGLPLEEWEERVVPLAGQERGKEDA